MSRVKDIKNIYLLTKLTKKASEFKTRERVVAEDNRLYEGSTRYMTRVDNLLALIRSQIGIL